MDMCELIAAVGPENVIFQNLDDCATALNYTARSGTQITFVSKMRITPSGTDKLGLVLWLDRDAVKAAVEDARTKALGAVHTLTEGN